MSRVGQGLCSVADPFPPFLWDEAGAASTAWEGTMGSGQVLCGAAGSEEAASSVAEGLQSWGSWQAKARLCLCVSARRHLPAAWEQV